MKTIIIIKFKKNNKICKNTNHREKNVIGYVFLDQLPANTMNHKSIGL